MLPNYYILWLLHFRRQAQSSVVVLARWPVTRTLTWAVMRPMFCMGVTYIDPVAPALVSGRAQHGPDIPPFSHIPFYIGVFADHRCIFIYKCWNVSEMLLKLTNLCDIIGCRPCETWDRTPPSWCCRRALWPVVTTPCFKSCALCFVWC